MKIAHPFTSPKTDGADATLVQPSNWNADHVVLVNGPALLGKPNSGTGSATEIPLGSGLSFVGGALTAATGPSLTVQDDGISLGIASTINFTGASVSASINGSVVTVDVTGGSSSSATNLSSSSTSTTVQVLSDTGADATLSAATTDLAGVMTGADKSKLNGIAAGATVNSADATLLDRTNHTGTQAISTVVGLQTALDGKATPSDVTAAITAVVGAAPAALDTLQEIAAQLATDQDAVSALTTAVSGKAPTVHNHVISDVTGLQIALDDKATAIHNHAISNVTGLQTALDGKAPTVHNHVISDVTGLQTALDGKAPTVHNHVISDVTGLQTALDDKATAAQGILASTAVQPAGLTKAAVGLSNVDNTSDANKPISTATATALSGKANISHNHVISDVTGLQTALDGKATSAQGALADTAVQPAGLTKAAVGLSNVDNTSDANKPISTAVQTALDTKAGTAVATLFADGLMSSSDKFNLNNAPSPQFLWDVVGARTPFFAHAGDSISYMTTFAQGDNYLTQALARSYPARLEYGAHRFVCYFGTLAAVVNGNGTATLTYNLAAGATPFMQSQLAVGKWLSMPTSGLTGAWNGVDLRILSFDNVAGTIVVNSNVEYLSVQGPLASFTTVNNVQLKISETVNNYSLAKGGHTSLQIRNGQIPIIQSWTVPPDVMFLNGGTNDGTYLTSHTNIIAVIEAALSAGVKIVAVMPMSPKDGMSGAALAQFISSKNILSTYARNRDGCFLLDPSGEFLDPTSLTYQPIGNSTGSLNAVMADGLHPSVRGAEVSSKYVVPLLQAVSALRRPKALSPGDVWDATNNKAGNILGSSGVMLAGTGGTWNGVANTAGTVAGWTYVTNTVATVGGATTPPVPSITNCDYVASGYKAQRFTLDGLSAASDGRVFSMTYTRFNSNIFGQRIDGELVMRINCPNIYAAGFFISVTGGHGVGDSGVADLGTSTARPAATITPNETNWVYLTIARPLLTFNQANNQNTQLQFVITVKALNSGVLSGFIEVAHCGAFALHTS